MFFLFFVVFSIFVVFARSASEYGFYGWFCTFWLCWDVFFEDVPPTFSSEFPWILIQILAEKGRKFIRKSVRKRNSHSERHFLIFWLTFLHFLTILARFGVPGRGQNCTKTGKKRSQKTSQKQEDKKTRKNWKKGVKALGPAERGGRRGGFRRGKRSLPGPESGRNFRIAKIQPKIEARIWKELAESV